MCHIAISCAVTLPLRFAYLKTQSWGLTVQESTLQHCTSVNRSHPMLGVTSWCKLLFFYRSPSVDAPGQLMRSCAMVCCNRFVIICSAECVAGGCPKALPDPTIAPLHMEDAAYHFTCQVDPCLPRQALSMACRPPEFCCHLSTLLEGSQT